MQDGRPDSRARDPRARSCAAMLREAGETVYEIGVIAARGEGASVTVA